jgi:hypothetical protein
MVSVSHQRGGDATGGFETIVHYVGVGVGIGGG